MCVCKHIVLLSCPNCALLSGLASLPGEPIGHPNRLGSHSARGNKEPQANGPAGPSGSPVQQATLTGLSHPEHWAQRTSPSLPAKWHGPAGVP